MKKINIISAIFAGAILVALTSCSSDNNNNANTIKTATAANTSAPSDLGIGPVSKVAIGALDETLANTGKSVFENKCTACHKIEAKHVGPALIGVTKRRKSEWIMNMILNPTEMTQKDPVAKELLATFMAPMANQNLSLDEARSILEYFRLIDSK